MKKNFKIFLKNFNNFYSKKVKKSTFWDHQVGTFESSSNESGLRILISGLLEGVTRITMPNMADIKNPSSPLFPDASKMLKNEVSTKIIITI